MTLKGEITLPTIAVNEAVIEGDPEGALYRQAKTIVNAYRALLALAASLFGE